MTTVREKNDSESRSLGRLLLGLYNTRIKNRIDTEEGESFDSLKRKLNPFIESIVKKYMVRSYERAGQQLLEKLKISSVPFFNIGNDGNKAIDIQINLFLEKFWRRIEKIEKRNQPLAAALSDINIDEEGEVTQNDNPLDPISYILASALFLIVKAFNFGKSLAPAETITKLQQSGTFENQEEIATLQSIKYKFVTAHDSNVDPVFCKPLEDQIFDSNDPNLPNPPLHNNCRCILEIVT